MSSKKPTQSNTLFNYFSSPKNTTKKTDIPKAKETTPLSKPLIFTKAPSIIKENIEGDDDDGDEDEEIPAPSKRRRIIAPISSDSEPENVSPNKRKGRSDNPPSKRHKFAFSDEDSDEEKTESSNSKKIPTKTSILEYSFSKTTNKTDESQDNEPKINIEPKSSSKISSKSLESLETNWVHEKVEFLKPEKIRDANKRRPSDPNYDSKTLYVPQDYLDSLTPAMRQWWILKSQNFDAVLFFKVGKFYELYHMDAVVGVQQLGFSYMKGEFAHSGFPESAYGKMTTMLVEKGFKVARIEQTETPDMMSLRCSQLKKITKFDKVVAREICQVTTKASCIFGAQIPEARSEIGTYLYGISAKINSDNTSRFGICFIETSIGIFRLCEFDDDKFCSKLLALFAEYPPGLVLLERGINYGPLKHLLNTQLKDVKQESLASKTEFCSGAAILETLYSECYFKDTEGKFQWPKLFGEIAHKCNPKAEYELVLKSLGGIHSFLKKSFLNIQLFSMQRFEKYEPLDLNLTTEIKHVERDYMILDATAIENLNLLGGKGSLQRTLDFCKTPFGKRMLPLWICRPLCNIEKIQMRQDAVKELFDNVQKLHAAQEILKKLPDLERQVAKIHAYGNKFCVTKHPDGRAILYEAKTYSKRKIMDLLKTLKGFEESQKIVDLFTDCESRLLRKLTQFQPNGMNVNLKETLRFFKEAFDHQEAEKEGTIIPKKGVVEEYDEAEKNIQEIEEELKDYLKGQSKYFGCQVNYFGTDKKRFQLEIPENKTHKAGSDYQLEGQRKGGKPVKRFSTSTTKELLQKMMRAENERNKVILDINRKIFDKFSQRYDKWQQVLHCLTLLDVLCALAEYASTFSGDICKPEIQSYSKKPFISILNGKHSCISNIENFVPNDTFMGANEKAPLLLLTGPNMGGKSTLMRQVSIISIMAQMGSFIPASKCSLSLIDRIFTRLGAFDDIVRGQSTFFVELGEASTILKHASKQSLLIIDELGRGTSTHDGNAIATAYVEKLISMQCRTLFSTHYHSLVDRFLENSNIQLAHMACMVENKDAEEAEEDVTLLYKLAEGRCPKSFGFNAAKLAGLSGEIVKRAREISHKIELEDKCRSVFRQVFNSNSENIPDVIKMLCSLDI